MPVTPEDLQALEALEGATADLQVSLAAAVQIAGAGATVAIAAMPAWPVFVAAGIGVAAAAVLFVHTDPEWALIAHIETELTYLEGPLAAGNPDEAARSLHRLRAAEAQLRTRYGVDLQAAPAPAEQTMPAPNAIQRAQPAQLPDALARIAVWQRAHHGLVHGQLVDAQGRADAETVAAASSAQAATAATVRAIRGVVDTVIPQAVRELTTSLRALRQAQQQANAELAHELERRADALAQRIGDLVRWLQTEALPDLEDELAVEKAARQQAIGQTRNLVDATTSPLASELAQIAPAVAALAGFGIGNLTHTAEKVGRNEQLIDQLGQLDLSSLLAFAGVPALTALVTRLMPPILEAGPRMLGALEGAAAAALGEL